MDIIIIKHTKSACLAQPVEHAAVNRSVGGSSPSTGAIVAARRTSQQLSVPRRVVCMYACGSSSRRKNARRSLCSSFLRNYRAALSFLLRAAASPRFLFFIVSSSNPLTLFSPCTTPRADQLAKTCYSVAPCAPYGGRVRWQAPSSPQGELRNTSRNSAGCLHVHLRLLFASQNCKTFAVLLVPAELSHRSLIFAPRGGFAAVSFFLSFLPRTP